MTTDVRARWRRSKSTEQVALRNLARRGESSERRLPGLALTDMPKYLGDVRCWVNSGKDLLREYFRFDPYRKSNSALE